MADSYYGLFGCDLIFSTYREFKQKRKKIKDTFDTFDIQHKVIYRMYIFSKPLLGEKQKEYIWDELIRDYTI